MRHCANCTCSLERMRETGDSSIYNQGRDLPDFELCMHCWNEEESLIESSGTNNHPTQLERYIANYKELGLL